MFSNIPRTRTNPLDPPPEFASIRDEQPVSQFRTPRGDLAWLVTRYDDIRAVLADRRFSSDPRSPGFPSYLTGDVPPPPGFFMQADAPDHGRLRRLVTKEFLAKHVTLMRPKMQSIVQGLLDELSKMKPPVDLVQAFALPVASTIICDLMGVPYEDHVFFQTRTDAILSQARTPEESEHAAIELMGYFDRVITEKEQTPSDGDLLSRMLHHSDGEMTHGEGVGIAALLLLAGYDTMAQIIGLGTLTLLQHPEQRKLLDETPSLASNLADELVRYLSVNHVGLPRAATEDVEIGGQQIKAGDGVLVMLNSGNRDKAIFDNPDAFDIHRDAKNHVGFGHGLHKCIGANFARAELEIVFPALFSALPSLALAAPIEELPFRHEMVLYGLHKLPVTW